MSIVDVFFLKKYKRKQQQQQQLGIVAQVYIIEVTIAH